MGWVHTCTILVMQYQLQPLRPLRLALSPPASSSASVMITLTAMAVPPRVTQTVQWNACQQQQQRQQQALSLNAL
jgi:hypothetical protein